MGVEMIIFSDFDGTLTKDNRELSLEFFEILETIKNLNSELVIVSGRSLSWGHFFLTHFPAIKTCIMEGGGVILYRNEHDDIVEEPLVLERETDELENFSQELVSKFSHLPLSKDSFGRLTDRAIEFNQMNEHEIDEVMKYMDKKGIHYSKSNVHINFWVGNISKYLGVQAYMKKFKPHLKDEECWFFGDAPNDQSMFELFHNSVGVSNIKHSLHKLIHKPRIILEGEENEGPKGVLNFLKQIN